MSVEHSGSKLGAKMTCPVRAKTARNGSAWGQWIQDLHFTVTGISRVLCVSRSSVGLAFDSSDNINERSIVEMKRSVQYGRVKLKPTSIVYHLVVLKS